MEILTLIIAVLLIALIVYAISRKLTLDSQEFDRQFDFNEAGVMEREHNAPLQFKGVGAQSTRPFKLEAGDYKIRYRFPEGVLVKVELLGAEDGDGEIIVLKSGRGEAGFTVISAGRYLLDIEPPDDDADWKLEINRLGLPSGYKPESQAI